MEGKDFFDVPRTKVRTSQGEVELPILYHDVSGLHAFFWTRPEGARKVLAGTGFEPMLFRGRAMVGLALYEYRKTSIGSYNEVGTALPVWRPSEGKPPNLLLDFFRSSRKRRGAMHIIDLPVTTAAAHAAGREIWGYPKFITKLPLTFGAGRFDGEVRDPGDTSSILKLGGKLGWGWIGRGMDLVLVSILGSRYIRTVVDVHARMKTGLGRGFTLQIGSSRHRMAENLRTLGLDGAHPAFVQTSITFQSRLNAGTPLGPVTP